MNLDLSDQEVNSDGHKEETEKTRRGSGRLSEAESLDAWRKNNQQNHTANPFCVFIE